VEPAVIEAQNGMEMLLGAGLSRKPVLTQWLAFQWLAFPGGRPSHVLVLYIFKSTLKPFPNIWECLHLLKQSSYNTYLHLP
jgi:hypothetical protein